MGLKGDIIAVGVAGAVLLVAGWYAKRKLTEAAGVVADAVAPYVPYVNPASEANVVNQAAMSFYQWASGSGGTLGGDLYDATHGGALSNGTFNPTSPNNVINRNVDSLYQWATGSNGTIGGDLYEWLY